MIDTNPRELRRDVGFRFVRFWFFYILKYEMPNDIYSTVEVHQEAIAKLLSRLVDASRKHGFNPP